jgi:adenylate cyclase
MVQQFMIDVNKCLNDYGGNIYQYVGDEVIVTWNTSRKNAMLCLRFFFACQKAILKNEKRYKEDYLMIPTFKAGIDCGIVTAVEIGDMKRDIAYHGDTVNTASRIQNLCNNVGKNMLISGGVYQLLSSSADLEVQHLGCFQLKGKEQMIELYSAEEVVDGEG